MTPPLEYVWLEGYHIFLHSIDIHDYLRRPYFRDAPAQGYWIDRQDPGLIIIALLGCPIGNRWGHRQPTQQPTGRICWPRQQEEHNESKTDISY